MQLKWDGESIKFSAAHTDKPNKHNYAKTLEASLKTRPLALKFVRIKQYSSKTICNHLIYKQRALTRF